MDIRGPASSVAHREFDAFLEVEGDLIAATRAHLRAFQRPSTTRDLLARRWQDFPVPHGARDIDVDAEQDTRELTRIALSLQDLGLRLSSVPVLERLTSRDRHLDHEIRVTEQEIERAAGDDARVAELGRDLRMLQTQRSEIRRLAGLVVEQRELLDTLQEMVLEPGRATEVERALEDLDERLRPVRDALRGQIPLARVLAADLAMERADTSEPAVSVVQDKSPERATRVR